MLRPKKSSVSTTALPVVTTARSSNGGNGAAASSHRHLHRRIKSHSSSSSSSIGLMTPREKLKMIGLSIVVLFSVLSVFTMAIRSSTRNLDHQMHQTTAQEDYTSLNSVDRQRRRSMTEQQQQQQQLAGDEYGYDYDLVVIGAGPAGLTASLFGARAGLSVLVLGSTASSQLYQATVLDNFPSFSGIASTSSSSSSSSHHQDWLKLTQRQAAAAGVHFALSGVTVNRIIITPTTNDGNPYFGLELSIHEAGRNNVVTARSIIVATGAVEKRLDLPGEAQLWSKSVHSCAICDGSLYYEKTVVVVGGGDAAVEAALLLSRIATKVIVVHRRNSFRASDQHNIETLEDLPNVQLYTPFVLQRYEVSRSNEELTGVVVQNTKTKAVEQIACDGVFVMIGSKPNTEFIQGTSLELDPEGYLVVQSRGGGGGGGGGGRTTTSTTTRTSTSVPGIFAAGQVADKTYRQAITAAAEGAQAAIDAERWLRQAYGSSTTSTSTSRTQQQRQLPVVPLQTIIEVKDMKNNNNNNPQTKAVVQKEKQQVSDCDLTKQECIQTIVRQYAVVVFSKPYCPYCKKALAALEMEGIKADGPHLHVIDLTATKDGGKAVQSTLMKMTGRRTVPNVFVGAKSIGGGDETSQLHKSGELRKLLEVRLSKDAPENDKDKGDDCDLTQEECIRSVTKRHPVVVFSKPYCPYCKKALAALEVEGVHAEPFLHVIDLTQRGDNGRAVQATLQKMTGRRTVPNVFVGGNSIGGGDETSQLHRQGKLKPLLETAKAFATTSTS